MKKIFFSTLCAIGLLSITSCSDYLETDSASTVDGNFVMSSEINIRLALNGAYETWRDCAQNKIFGDGLWYAADIPGSDITRHPEAFSNQPGRHWVECLYQNGGFASQYNLLSYLKEDDAFASLYKVIAVSNAIINSIENRSDYDEIIGGIPSELGQMYGEAIAMRATAYRELIKNFGDVPYSTEIGQAPQGLVNREWIYDKCLEELQIVEPVMYPIGQIKISGSTVTTKNYFSQTYVDGLIGRMALEAGGYQTRRGDIERKDLEGNTIAFEQMGTENNGATYCRRADWKKYYTIAKTYFKKAIKEHAGSAKFYTEDPRNTDEQGRRFDNPYQYFFQQMMEADDVYADESIYEYPMQQGGGNDGRPYSFGRPSDGGSKDAYPCKSYGQGRINPAFYYGVFDPKDKRRDVACTVTGSDGKGNEKLIPFTPNSKASGGGISLSKWDENRQKRPWHEAQRKSGINGPYMRMAEMYLGYAEACAATGDVSEARTYLDIVRNRAFDSAADAKTDEFITKEGSLLNAIVQERGFEFAGEGDRRFTLVRTGLMPAKIRIIKEMTRAMIDGLKTKGYYEFENGNVISSQVWTKLVDAKSQYGYRLTAQCPIGQENDPVLYPSWRGQNDAWEEWGCKYSNTKTNLAIKGLFTKLSADEIASLESQGYKKVDWGKNIVDNEDEYYMYLFYDYDYTKAPIYLWPFTPQVIATGGFTNGYGFKNE